MTDAKRIDEIGERLSKATPGEWGAAIYSTTTQVAEYEAEVSFARDQWGISHDWAKLIGCNSIANADFIAHAPTDIAYLLKEVAQRDARIKVLEDVRDTVGKFSLRITELESALQAAREAMEPFAKKADAIDDGQDGCEDAHTTMQAGDFFAVRAVYEALPPPQDAQND